MLQCLLETKQWLASSWESSALGLDILVDLNVRLTEHEAVKIVEKGNNEVVKIVKKEYKTNPVLQN